MKGDKHKILYIIAVFLLLGFFTGRSYNIGEPSFFVLVIIVAFIIGVVGVYLFGKDMKLYKNLYFLSYVITIGLTFVPGVGVYVEDGRHSYGFPAQWFSYYHLGDMIDFHLLGFLFNFFMFYFLLRLFKKMYLSFSKNKVKLNDV